MTSKNAKHAMFQVTSVASHLADLKAKAKAEGKEDGPWWRPTLNFEGFANLRNAAEGSRFGSISYTDRDGINGRLVVRVFDEHHTGMIQPNTDAAVQEMQLRLKNKNFQIKKRDGKKPVLQIQKWATKVQTEADGITIKTDDKGKPILPGDDKLSPYFIVASFVHEAFQFEANERIERGTVLYDTATKMKKADKSVTAQAVLEALGPHAPGDTIIMSTQVDTLRKTFQADVETLIKGAIVQVNTKVTNVIQEFIGPNAIKNANKPLPNPMTRITLPFSKEDGKAQVAIHDKGQAFMSDGKQKFELGKVNGLPVNVDNVHEFVTSGATFDGIISMDSICFSGMGISLPIKASVIVMSLPNRRDVSADDLYDDFDAPMTSAVTPATEPEPEETGANDYDNMLSALAATE